jgi:hypothetical protein
MTWDEADDGQVSDDGDWVVGTAKREGKKEWQKIKGERLFFFQYLHPIFSSFQDMKSSSIYRGWKRDVWSPLVPNLSPWIDSEGSQLLVQSRHHRLSDLLQRG